MQTSYGCIIQKKTSVAAINIILGVPGPRADKSLGFGEAADIYVGALLALPFGLSRCPQNICKRTLHGCVCVVSR